MLDPEEIKERSHKAVLLWNQLHHLETNDYNRAKVFSKQIGCRLVLLPRSRWYLKGHDLSLLGTTNGDHIHVREISDITTFFTFFHEVGHVILHFRSGRINTLSQKNLELEADLYAKYVCLELWPEHSSTIEECAKNNPHTHAV